MKRFLACLVLLPLLGFTATAAELEGEPYFESVGDGDVITDGIVSALAQDQAGYLWIGTASGLIRYDGYRFRKFQFRREDPFSLPEDRVRDLLALPDGRLAVATQSGGVAMYRPATQDFLRYTNDPEDAQSPADTGALEMSYDSRGGIWLATSRGVDYWDLSNNHFRHYSAGDNQFGGLPHELVRSVLVDRRGDLWAGTRNGLARLRVGQTRFEAVASQAGDPTGLAGQYVYTLYESSDGRIWAGTQNHGAVAIDPQSGRHVHFPADPDSPDALPHPWVASFQEIRPGRLWINSFGGGIAELDLASDRIVSVWRHDPAVSSSLALDQVTVALRDRAGLLWVGSWGGGLQRINPNGGAFISIHASPTRHGLSDGNVMSVLPLPDGQLWLGTGGKGIDVFDPRHGWLPGFRPSPLTPGALRDGSIRAMARTSDGTIWVGTQQAGLHRYLGQGRGFRRIRQTDIDSDERINVLYALRNNHLIVASERGALEFDPSSERFDQLTMIDGTPFNNWANGVAETPDGTLWISSINGLAFRRSNERSLHNVTATSRRPDALLGSRIASLLVDSRGRLWVATAGGINLLSGWEGGEPHFVPSPWNRLIDSMPLSSSQLIEDGQGRLWSSRQMFDPSNGRVFDFGRADGFDVGSPNFLAPKRAADGRLILGGTRGLLIIDPARFHPWDDQPPLVMTGLSIDGRRLTTQVSTLSLKPDQRNFAVEFAALDFSAPQRLRYRYQLEGLSGHWIETDAGNRIASFGGLWPGSYTLRVQGSNRAGDWSPHELRLPVTVLPAFWQTPWFAAALLMTILALAHAGVRWRTRMIRRRAEHLQSLVTQRSDELIEAQRRLGLSDKLASLGTLTAGVAHEINNPTNFIAGAAQNLAVLMQRFRTYLHQLGGDDTDPAVWAAIDRELAPQQEQLATILDGTLRISRIVGDLRQFTRLDEAERKRIRIGEPIQSTINLVRTRFDRIHFEVDLGMNPELDCQPAKLSQVFMNLIVNACEATQDSKRMGWVRIATAETDTEVVVHIEDNGPGMDEATRLRVFEPFFTTKDVGKGTGLGLAVSLGILREHGGEIDVSSIPGQGCRFTVRLPR